MDTFTTFIKMQFLAIALLLQVFALQAQTGPEKTIINTQMNELKLQVFQDHQMKFMQIASRHPSTLRNSGVKPTKLQSESWCEQRGTDEPGTYLPKEGISDDTPCNPDDSLALVAFYNSTNGQNWANSFNWLTGPVNSWFGITVANGFVSLMWLPENGLSGSLPPEIGNLSNLQMLYLYSNLIGGNIPPEIGNLSNMLNLYLSDNKFSGNIPPEIGNLSNIINLDFHLNQLSGSIPPEIGNLSTLQTLYLYSNQLTGNIPPEIGNLASLQTLYLSANLLSGSIPPEIGNLDSIIILGLHLNQLNGTIPPEIGNLINLQWLYLYANHLTGNIPPEIGNLSNLQVLYLSGNLFTSIPPEIGNLNNLYWLDLYDNQLTGNIPPEIGSLTNLQYLFLSYNQLSGSIPPEIGNLDVLQETDLENNQLTGSIPAEMCNISNLNLFTFQNNYLDMGSCQAISCLMTNGVNMYDGTQLNGNNLLTDCDLANISVDPATLFQVLAPYETASQTVIITNVGFGNLNWSLEVMSENTIVWLSADLLSGILGPDESSNVTVTISSTGLDLGTYSGAILITSNDSGTPSLEIPVQLTVQTDETQTINLSLGWTCISSYLIPKNTGIEQLFSSISGDLIIVQNFGGQYYQPTGNNTLVNWNCQEGYFVKTNSATTLVILGYQQQSTEIALTAGWNLLPVLSSENVTIIDLFAGQLDKLKIVKESIGQQMYWPEIQISTLQILEPGKSYLIYLFQDATLSF